MLDIRDIEQYFSDNREDEVVRRVKDWAASSEENQNELTMLELIYGTSLNEGMDRAEAEAAWTDLEPLLEESAASVDQVQAVREEATIISMAAKIMSYAAIGLALLGLFFVMRPNPIYDTVASVGVGQNFILADGSKIQLGPESQLTFPIDFAAFSERRVKLKGQATFDVTKNGKTFIVESYGREVKVLGTILKYESMPSMAILENIEGLISFYEIGKESGAITLKEGEKAVFVAGRGVQKDEPEPEPIVVPEPVAAPAPQVSEPEPTPEPEPEPEPVVEPEPEPAPIEIPWVTINLDTIADLLMRQFPGEVEMKKRLRVKKREVEIRDLSYYGSMREAYGMLQEQINFRGRQDAEGKFIIEEISAKK